MIVCCITLITTIQYLLNYYDHNLEVGYFGSSIITGVSQGRGEGAMPLAKNISSISYSHQD